MLRTIEMCDVCQINSESLLTDLTVKDLFLLALFVVLDSTSILFNADLLLSTNQHALVSSSLSDWLGNLLV
jgi:hypothetical protein